MHTIDIDDDVYNLLNSQPKRFEDTPNTILRRMLGIDETPWADKPGRRKPNIDLQMLIEEGYLESGQILHFVDHRRKRHPGMCARLSDVGLEYEGESYSSSALAKKFLHMTGKVTSAVRGPNYFETEKGELLQTLWEACLNTNQQSNS